MASAALTGPGLQVPCNHPAITNNTPAFGTITIDATGEKAAFLGRVWFQGRTGSKDIRKVGFRFGTVTKSGGSGLTVSLQNVAAAGPPMQPDETQDQTVAIANGNASFVSNTWIQTGNLSADRTVNFGDQLAVVIEFDGSGRQSPDSVQISGLASTLAVGHFYGTSLKTSGSWAAQLIIPNVILEFSDGTFGTLWGAFPCSAISSQTVVSNGNPDEVAMSFVFPGPVSIEGCGGWLSSATGGDAEFVLYTGVTDQRTRSVNDQNMRSASGNAPAAELFDSPYELAANTTAYIAVKATTVNSVSLLYFAVAAAGHWQAHVGGDDWCFQSRQDLAGSWTAASTSRPFLWVFVSGIDDAGGPVGRSLIATRASTY